MQHDSPTAGKIFLTSTCNLFLAEISASTSTAILEQDVIFFAAHTLPPPAHTHAHPPPSHTHTHTHTQSVNTGRTEPVPSEPREPAATDNSDQKSDLNAHF
ncbi:hypothetical protein CHARACLAT_010609 [Characodon lateralis]|uniref:Uncharacterized protein n=1 Tax=Characodon lateralis TaxID=208331 RepID=A0ABU7EI07_9TELE|nr:hypothetical protein [Characodon lateralis]